MGKQKLFLLHVNSAFTGLHRVWILVLKQRLASLIPNYHKPSSCTPSSHEGIPGAGCELLFGNSRILTFVSALEALGAQSEQDVLVVPSASSAKGSPGAEQWAWLCARQILDCHEEGFTFN